MNNPFSSLENSHERKKRLVDRSRGGESIMGILSDPEFSKMWPGPADFQYSMLIEDFLSSPESTRNSLHLLSEIAQDPKKPLFAKLRFAEFLRTALGNRGLEYRDYETYGIIASGLEEIKNAPGTPYFLGVLLNPDLVLSPEQSFSKMEKGLTPIQVTKDVYIQDNGHDPIPLFYQISNPEKFEQVIAIQAEQFAAARPENRPEVPKNASLAEMVAFKKKYLDPHIHMDKNKEEVMARRGEYSRRMSIEEVAAFFPHIQRPHELLDDDTLMEFRSFVMPAVRKQMERDFGISFSQVPLTQQVYFLSTIALKPNDQIRQVQSFVKTFGTDGLGSFLSLEHDRNLGNKIIEIGNRLPVDVARGVLKKYAEISVRTEQLEHVVADSLIRGTAPTQQDREHIRRILSKKGADLIERFHTKVGSDADADGLIADLERVNADTLMALSAYRHFAQLGGTVSIEQIAGAEFGVVRGDELASEDITEMVGIYKKNWATYENQQLIQGVINDFESSLRGPSNHNEKIYVFKQYGKISSFVRFSPDADGTLRASALNVDESVQHFGLGEAMMDKALSTEAQHSILKATCDPYSQSNMRYMEKGFIATGYTEDHPKVMTLLWDEKSNEALMSKHLSVQEIISHQGTDAVIIRSAGTLEELHKEIPPGTGLTRCFYDQQSMAWFAAYERLPVSFGTAQEKTP